MTEDSGNRTGTRWVRAWPGALEAVRAAGMDDLASLTSPARGDAVATARSSWVRTFSIGTIKVYAKTYDYPSPTDRRRGIGRTTALARSRAAREWDALAWLREHGFAAPAPLLVGEQRQRLLLRRAVLLTEAWNGEPLDALLPALAPDDARALIAAVRAEVAAWHAAGFRDRNLDPRNLLARRGPNGWTIAKIDSPRHRLRRPGAREDRLTRADWARLDRGLAELRTR